MTATHVIRTVADFMSLEPEKRAVAIREFAVWCDLMDFVKAMKAAGIADTHSDPAVFEWIDDGKGEARLSFQTEDGVEIDKLIGKIR